jgi:two-component system, OmpR family, sensor histidine kinase TctE
MRRADGYVEFAIDDDGIGLTEDQFDPALSRFGQVTPSAGSGLGLPIAMAVAEGAGGRLKLTTLTKGMAVCISFPEFFGRDARAIAGNL